jgi:hypothetical protein
VRPLLILLIAAVLAVGVDQLGDLTQTRPEAIDPDSRAQVTLSVEIHGYLGPTEDAARALWAVCQPQLGSRTRVLSPAQVSGAQLSVIVSPAPGPTSTKRLRGCLDDATIDRVRGDLDSVVVLEA